MNQSISEVKIRRFGSSGMVDSLDVLAVEEPMEIRLEFSQLGRKQARSVSITMRTPGDDFDLAVGFLFTESIIERHEQVASIQHCGPKTGDTLLQNVVKVELTPDVNIDFGRLERHFYTSSSCGVCGKTSLEALAPSGCLAAISDNLSISPDVIRRLPAIQREAQAVFTKTGGLHGAALFDQEATLLGIREDVGRHNAVDKLIGSEFLKGRVPLRNSILLLSGRASFELIQKAVIARIPVVAAVGAPSSLAVELAIKYNQTLLGFVKADRFNIYCGVQRIS